MKKKHTIFIFSLLYCLVSTSCWSSDSKSNRTIAGNYLSNVSETNKNSTNGSKNNNSSNKMTETPTTQIKSGGYTANLPNGFSQPTDAVGQRILKEYGALFVARGGAVPPNTAIFKNEAEVSSFQAGLSKASENLGGFNIELQTAAMKALKEAIAEAKQNNLTITPNGDDAGKRDYAGTVNLWASRVNPGLTHWVGKGRLTEAEASRIRALSPFEQVPEIFKHESQGIFFSKDFSKSIVYSVAPPGTSQHLLAKHGWYQTVASDLPHFTFLGVSENQLTGLGLKKVSDGGRNYWLPSL
jgi:hypothetical protein